jgi:hypothetical protein
MAITLHESAVTVNQSGAWELGLDENAPDEPRRSQPLPHLFGVILSHRQFYN